MAAVVQAGLPLTGEPVRYPVAELKRLGKIARERGDATTAALIAAAVVKRDDDDELPVSPDTAAVLEGLGR